MTVNQALSNQRMILWVGGILEPLRFLWLEHKIAC